MKNAKGFTLIELVIVIVILGILAATVAPKFANLQKDAKIAAVKGLEGSVKAAANIVRAKWLAIDNVSVLAVDIDGDNAENVDVFYNAAATYQSINGYPAETANGIIRALDLDPKKFSHSAYAAGYRIYYNGTNANEVNGDGDDLGCGVHYNLVAPVGTNPAKIVISTETGGC